MDAYEIHFKTSVVALVRASKDLCNALDAVARCKGDPLGEQVALQIALGVRYDVLKALKAIEGR